MSYGHHAHDTMLMECHMEAECHMDTMLMTPCSWSVIFTGCVCVVFTSAWLSCSSQELLKCKVPLRARGLLGLGLGLGLGLECKDPV